MIDGNVFMIAEKDDIRELIENWLNTKKTFMSIKE
jgi:hypothetical protein